MFKGVCWHSLQKKWRASIALEVDGGSKLVDLGGFDSEVDAATRYDVAARGLFGEFASLNFPDKEPAKGVM